MHKKIIVVYGAFILLFGGIILQIYAIMESGYLRVSDAQSSYIVDLAQTRGYIYDIKYRPFVNIDTEYAAAIMPSPETLSAVTDAVTEEQKADILPRFETGLPFLYKLDTGDIYANGVDIVKAKKRYQKEQLAPHLIGYLENASGSGISGIEGAYDDFLTEHGGSIKVRYRVDALGNILQGKAPEVINKNYDSPAGVVLTLDSNIQRLAENAAKKYFDVGSVVVMDVDTGDIKASVSLPVFDPNNQEASIYSPNAPFVNRSFHGEYSVGSTFKLLVAATALEQGVSKYYTYDCQGSIEVGGKIFKCHKLDGHGVLDMQGATEKSCNPYFVSLMMKIGSESVRYKASEIGFGKSVAFTETYKTSSGTLPTSADLKNIAERANFSFGQGKLTANPVQIAQMIATIANSGLSVVPRIVEGTTLDGKTISEHTVTYAQNRIIQQGAANQVAQFMVSTVDVGSGKKAKPEQGGAGGKTGSSQTGRYIDGKEVVHAWFAGFFPARRPQYAIVVLAEGRESGGDVAAPVFKEIADGINALTPN